MRSMFHVHGQVQSQNEKSFKKSLTSNISINADIVTNTNISQHRPKPLPRSRKYRLEVVLTSLQFHFASFFKKTVPESFEVVVQLAPCRLHLGVVSDIFLLHFRSQNR